jgi:hypothetical protein
MAFSRVLAILDLADGAINPPHFYYSQAEIDAALHAAGQVVLECLPNQHSPCEDVVAPAATAPTATTTATTPITTIPHVPVVPPVQGIETNSAVETQGKLSSGGLMR